MTRPTRRDVLRLGLAVPFIAIGRDGRRQGLGGFTTASGDPSCSNARTLTPAVPPEFYKSGSPARRSLGEAGVTGPPLTLAGAVVGLRCGAIKDARLEFWQADAKGMYDMAGFRLRGEQRTDASGRYALETIVPGASSGRAPKIYVRVRPPVAIDLTTVLFFPGQVLNTRDPAFNAALVLALEAGRGGSSAHYDFVVDL